MPLLLPAEVLSMQSLHFESSQNGDEHGRPRGEGSSFNEIFRVPNTCFLLQVAKLLWSRLLQPTLLSTKITYTVPHILIRTTTIIRQYIHIKNNPCNY